MGPPTVEFNQRLHVDRCSIPVCCLLVDLWSWNHVALGWTHKHSRKWSWGYFDEHLLWHVYYLCRHIYGYFYLCWECHWRRQYSKSSILFSFISYLHSCGNSLLANHPDYFLRCHYLFLHQQWFYHRACVINFILLLHRCSPRFDLIRARRSFERPEPPSDNHRSPDSLYLWTLGSPRDLFRFQVRHEHLRALARVLL